MIEMRRHMFWEVFDESMRLGAHPHRIIHDNKELLLDWLLEYTTGPQSTRTRGKAGLLEVIHSYGYWSEGEFNQAINKSNLYEAMEGGF